MGKDYAFILEETGGYGGKVSARSGTALFNEGKVVSCPLCRVAFRCCKKRKKGEAEQLLKDECPACHKTIEVMA